MRKLRTLHVDSEKGWGGGQRQVSALCSYLLEQGHDVKLICRPNSKLQNWAVNNGIDVYSVEMKSTLSLGAVRKIKSIIEDEKPDVVHLHASRAHVLGSAAARLAKVPVVLATRRMQDRIKMIWPNTSAYGKWTTALVAISDAVRNSMIESGVDSKKIRIIESGCDVEAFYNVKPCPCFSSQGGSILTLGTAANLSEGKGISYLIEACSILKSRGTNVRLLVAGDGHDRLKLEDLASELEIDSSFLGFQEDMPKFLESIDIFVMPSLAEALGIAVLEAMAAGRPVIASAVGGLKESVVHGVTGFLVPPANSEEIANAVERLASDFGLIRKFAESGKARVIEKYSLNNMSRRNEALYYELLSES